MAPVPADVPPQEPVYHVHAAEVFNVPVAVSVVPAPPLHIVDAPALTVGVVAPGPLIVQLEVVPVYVQDPALYNTVFPLSSRK